MSGGNLPSAGQALFAAEPRLGVLEASRRLRVARGTVQARLERLREDLAQMPSLSLDGAIGVPLDALTVLDAGRAASDRVASRNRRHATVTNQPFASRGGSAGQTRTASTSASWTASSAVAKSMPRRTRTPSTRGTSSLRSTPSTPAPDITR